MSCLRTVFSTPYFRSIGLKAQNLFDHALGNREPPPPPPPLKVFPNSGNTQLKRVENPRAFGQTNLSKFNEFCVSLVPKCDRDIPISVYIINYNEGDRLALALHSVSRAQEVILVDKESTDGSAEKYSHLATRYVKSSWSPVVEDTRALADSLCKFPWRICLDADEFLTPQSLDLMSHIASNPDDTTDVYQIYIENYFSGIECKTNVYGPRPISRIYRSGALDLQAKTHSQHSIDSANVRVISPRYGAKIIHLNQDSFFEYFEKANRYTETYMTGYSPPETPEDFFSFAQKKIEEFKLGTAHKHIHDGAFDMATSLYYCIEYLKQWEREAIGNISERYIAIAQKYLRSYSVARTDKDLRVLLIDSAQILEEAFNMVCLNLDTPFIFIGEKHLSGHFKEALPNVKFIHLLDQFPEIFDESWFEGVDLDQNSTIYCSATIGERITSRHKLVIL